MATLLTFLIFCSLPDGMTWLGAGIIVGSGITLLIVRLRKRVPPRLLRRLLRSVRLNGNTLKDRGPNALSRQTPHHRVPVQALILSPDIDFKEGNGMRPVLSETQFRT